MVGQMGKNPVISKQKTKLPPPMDYHALYRNKQQTHMQHLFGKYKFLKMVLKDI